MSTHHTIDNPEDLAYIDRWSKRMLIFCIGFYALLLPARPFIPKARLGSPIVLGIILLVCFAIFFLIARPRHLRSVLRRNNVTWGKKTALPYPISVRFIMAGAAIILPISAIMGIAFSNAIGLAFLIIMPLYGLGFALIQCHRLHEPGPLSCPRCAYPVDPPDFPAMCSECAKPMPTANAATRTPVVKRPAMLWSGVALLTATAALSLGLLRAPSLLINTLPRAARLAMAATSEDAFATIDTTTLTEPERVALTNRVLDAIESGSFFMFSDQIEWLGDQLIAGTLDPEQAERLIIGDGGYKLITRPAPDGTTELSIQPTGDSISIRSLRVLIFMGGFEVGHPDEHPQPLARSDSPWGGPGLASSFAERDDFDAAYPDLPPSSTRSSVFIDAPSGTPVRVRIVIAVYPNTGAPAGPTPRSITWHDDGTHTITPQPLAVYERTAEAIIDPTP